VRTTPDTATRFLSLLDTQRDALWRFVRSMVWDRHVAEDLMSESVLQAYEAFPRLRDEAAFASFLLTIAHRVVKRHRWRRRLFGEYNEEAALNQPHSDPLPDEQTDAALLRDALARLPAAQREAVVLADVLDMPYEEIRRIQGGTLSGVKTRVRRGRAALVRLLTDDAALDEAVAAPVDRHDVTELVSNSPIVLP
jgi:RNA polymerase sigma-70 factor (ECF subfamily)